VRALILSAPVGESHLVMAQAVAAELASVDPTGSVAVENSWGVLGPALGAILSRGYDVHLGDVGWTYELAYRLFTGWRPARRPAELALTALGGPALARLISARRPDLVVSTHPVISTVLGRLRASGRLASRLALVVGPIGGLAFWAHPGADQHLLLYGETLGEIEREVGRGRSVAVRPLLGAAFDPPPDRAGARRHLNLPAERAVVLVSGGGWGAGDLSGAVGATLALGSVQVAVVTGRNERAQEQLARRYRTEPRVRLLGFTHQMAAWLAAADVLVTATAGLSCLEAEVCGCQTVCYGYSIGHIADNVRALQRHGLAGAAASPAELSRQLAGVLDAPRPRPPDRRALPRAGAVLADLVSRPRPPGRLPVPVGGAG
jgi:processive 1,2-diacylglycerol beta-glucosyltransferase